MTQAFFKLFLVLGLFSTVSSIPYILSQTLSPHSNYIFEIDMSADNQWIVAGSTDNSVSITKKGSNGQYSTVQTLSFGSSIVCASLSSDGQTLAAGDTA